MPVTRRTKRATRSAGLMEWVERLVAAKYLCGNVEAARLAALAALVLLSRTLLMGSEFHEVNRFCTSIGGFFPNRPGPYE